MKPRQELQLFVVAWRQELQPLGHSQALQESGPFHLRIWSLHRALASPSFSVQPIASLVGPMEFLEELLQVLALHYLKAHSGTGLPRVSQRMLFLQFARFPGFVR